jgi:cholesterol oxidase
MSAWKLPAEALRIAAGRWHVKSEPGWGAAHAVFAPVRQQSGGWRLALPEHAVLPLSAIDDTGWTPLAMPPSDGATHYLCMLRYDQPPQRPGKAYFRARHPATPAPQQAVNAAASTTHVAAAELEREVTRLRQALGEKFARYLVQPLGATATDTARPGPVPEQLCFAFASCQYPAGMLDRVVAHAGYRALARYLERPGAAWPERLLLLGDQVYTDATSGLLDPVRLEDRFRIPYEDMLDREMGPLGELPQEFLGRVRMTPDDHEIGDNWEPFRPGGTGPRYRHGLAAYWQHQRPGEPRSRAVQILEQGSGWHLFMADSRTQRAHRSADTLDRALLLGLEQTEQLEAWLLQAPGESLKIVSSAALLLPRSRESIDDPLYLDNWQGYPASFCRLLAFVCDHQLRNLVFLSGDLHLGCRAEVTVRNVESGASVEFQSCHAPALYAPYPFANETEWNLLLHDSFRFDAVRAGTRQSYECMVDAQVLAPGRNGCALLKATRSGTDWSATVEVVG